MSRYNDQRGTGTGVGLSISHGLISAHKGRLELLASPAGGALFQVTLPVVSGTENTAPAQQPTPATSDAVWVLIVDDEEDLAEMIEDMLRSRGHHATVATGGHAALALLQEQTFDVILSDLNLPDLNGQEFYACLQRDYPEYVEKIAFVTGDTLGASAQQFLAEGSKPHIEKPFTPNDIRELVITIAQR